MLVRMVDDDAPIPGVRFGGMQVRWEAQRMGYNVRNGYPASAEEYEEAIEQILAEMRTLGEQWRRNQGEIDRIRLKSEPVRAEIRSMLVGLGKQV